MEPRTVDSAVDQFCFWFATCSAIVVSVLIALFGKLAGMAWRGRLGAAP